MIEFNKCDGKSMNRNDNSCSYNEIPQGEFQWNRDVTYENFACKYHKNI
ncbi:hypothetical protein BpHYR1_027195 [Brachionus plicatilis]|uniref:Uncharacterized protein n=1 Tax=Brachionus plicatilis TaxID=10195 RepID=A0A3M7P475_BRAPC|nr:hypothetical protein BpHYR1_027195 [Brachionus plicatilis]